MLLHDALALSIWTYIAIDPLWPYACPVHMALHHCWPAETNTCPLYRTTAGCWPFQTLYLASAYGSVSLLIHLNLCLSHCMETQPHNSCHTEPKQEQMPASTCFCWIQSQSYDVCRFLQNVCNKPPYYTASITKIIFNRITLTKRKTFS
jgi:hypothetical protein